MDAVVTLKATVTDLDLIRRALDTHAVLQTTTIRSEHASPRERREARTELLKTQDLARKIR